MNCAGETGLGSKKIKPYAGLGIGVLGWEWRCCCGRGGSSGPLRGSSGHERDFFPLANTQLGLSFPQSPTQHFFLCPAAIPKSSQAFFSPLAPTGVPCVVKPLPAASAPGSLLRPGTALGSLCGAQRALS